MLAIISNRLFVEFVYFAPLRYIPAHTTGDMFLDNTTADFVDLYCCRL